MAFYGGKAKKEKNSGLWVLVGQAEFTVYLTDQIDMHSGSKEEEKYVSAKAECN